jgi:monoamine oxidase
MLISIETVGGAQDSKVEGGAQSIPIKLLQKISDPSTSKSGSSFHIELNSPVRSITRVNNEYVITTRNNKQFNCKYIIMAMPPTLQIRIEYSPPLPALRDQLLQRFPMAHAIKTVTFFKTKWWRENKMAGFFASVHCKDRPLTNGFDGTNTNTMVAFIMGNNARYWSRKTKQERIDAVLKQYAEMFTRDYEFVKDQFVHYLERDWASEEFSRGAYEGFTTPGGNVDCFRY